MRQVAIFAGEGEVDDGGAEEEDEGYEAFGEDGEGEGRPHEVGVAGGRDKLSVRGARLTSQNRDVGHPVLAGRGIGGSSRGRCRGGGRAGLRG